MGYRLAGTNFSRGILSPKLHARWDTAAYQAGAADLYNVVILPTGGVTKRVGTRFVAKAHDQDPAKPCRLVPFEYSLDQTYVLEFGQGYMRPAANGGMVLEDALAVTSITNAANAQVTAAYHGYAVGDDVYFAGIQGMTEINTQTATVAAVMDANNFTIALDTTAYGAFTGSTGGATNTAPPTPPPTPPAVPDPVPNPPPPATTEPNRPLHGAEQQP